MDDVNNTQKFLVSDKIQKTILVREKCFHFYNQKIGQNDVREKVTKFFDEVKKILSDGKLCSTKNFVRESLHLQAVFT